MLVELVDETIADAEARKDAIEAELETLREIKALAGRLNGGGSATSSAAAPAQASRPAAARPTQPRARTEAADPPSRSRASRPAPETSAGRRSERPGSRNGQPGQPPTTGASAGGEPALRTRASAEHRRSQVLQLIGRAGAEGITQADVAHQLEIPQIHDYLKPLEKQGKIKRIGMRVGSRGGRSSPVWVTTSTPGISGTAPQQPATSASPSPKSEAKQKIKAAVGQVLWNETEMSGPELHAAVRDKLGIEAINSELFAAAVQELVDDNEVKRTPTGNRRGFTYRVAQ